MVAELRKRLLGIETYVPVAFAIAVELDLRTQQSAAAALQETDSKLNVIQNCVHQHAERRRSPAVPRRHDPGRLLSPPGETRPQRGLNGAVGR
jgi:hypothetical protein